MKILYNKSKSMLILYQFECKRCSYEFEDLVAFDDRDRSIRCPSCKGNASRVLSPVRSKLDGTDPAFTTAYDKWEKVHREEAKKDPSGDYDNLSELQMKTLKAQRP